MDKQQLRQIAYAARNDQADKDALSAGICDRFISQSWYQSAQTVLWYVHCRSEVRTLSALCRELANGKHIVVPYCTVDCNGERQLGLWRLNAVDELRPGMWNILEPPRERWAETGRRIAVEELDAVMVPGVAFDKHGGRLGNGAGYYDRLLGKVSADTVLAAVCYESQLLPRVPMEAHDVYLNFVITEKTIYAGQRQRD
ncbi:MAG: 5-formyltetrahydrofolate cyclo-ligase [Methylococcaceae bacterium]|nr:5-formyltetrahydrofolate cyclo-ligase [Methylococcaceae bacterium]